MQLCNDIAGYVVKIPETRKENSDMFMAESNKYSLFTVFFLVTGIWLQGCSSGGSNADANANAGINADASTDATANPNTDNDSLAFTQPVDSDSLKAAISTGLPAAQNKQHWECATADGNTRISYQMFSDNTGIATNLSSGGTPSDFTWQATSATSMTTTATGTGAVDTVSDIQFSDSKSMSLTVNTSQSFTCKKKENDTQADVPVPPLPAANNTLSYSGVVYPLTHGFEETFSYRPSQRGDTHRLHEFQVADKEFKQTQIIVGFETPLILHRPHSATVWLRLDLHVPGGDNFQSATFEFIPEDVDDNGPEVAGKFFFNDGALGIDRDGVDGIDSDANEFIDVVGGTVSVTRGADKQALMAFDLSLEDGTNLSGSFSGLFIVYAF